MSSSEPDDRPLLNRLEWHSVTLNEPAGGIAGYRRLIGEALYEIRRLAERINKMQPVKCFTCGSEIERSDEWFRCFDCRAHVCESCIRSHFGHDKRLNSLTDLAAALRGYMQNFPIFREKPIGAPESDCRAHQEAMIELEDKAISAIAKAGL